MTVQQEAMAQLENTVKVQQDTLVLLQQKLQDLIDKL